MPHQRLAWCTVTDTMPDRRLLLVHAHPDDESSQTAATMARYVAEGAQVSLVTCTLGELGEIVDEELAKTLTVGDSLGRHRVAELADAMVELGVTDHIRLGGDGRWHDSGMAAGDDFGARALDEVAEGAFWNADLLEAALPLVEIIRSRRPQVLITYDPFGGYGHPDHVMAHRVAMYAAGLAASGYRPDLGEPWQIARIFWMTMSGDDAVVMLQRAQDAGVEVPWSLDLENLPPMFTRDAQLAARVPTLAWNDRKVAALRAHRSQVSLEDPFWAMMTAADDRTSECYVLACGVPMPAGGPSDDLFAGLED